MEKEYETTDWYTTDWYFLKQDLLATFGKKDRSYTFEEKYQIFTSLYQTENESFATYLLRVQWVLSTALNPNDLNWTDIVFLLGIEEPNRSYFLNKIISVVGTKTSLWDIVEETDKKLSAPKEEPVPQVELDRFDVIEDDDDEETVEAKKEYPEVFLVAQSEALDGNVSDQKEDDEIPLSSLKKKKKKGDKRSPDPENPYQCQVSGCSKAYNRSSRLRHHMKKHNVLGCLGCGLKDVVMTPDEWDKHETDYHLGKCVLCPLSFNDLKSMRQHHQADHRGRETKCSKCKRHIRLNPKYHHVDCLKNNSSLKIKLKLTKDQETLQKSRKEKSDGQVQGEKRKETKHHRKRTPTLSP